MGRIVRIPVARIQSGIGARDPGPPPEYPPSMVAPAFDAPTREKFQAARSSPRYRELMALDPDRGPLVQKRLGLCVTGVGAFLLAGILLVVPIGGRHGVSYRAEPSPVLAGLAAAYGVFAVLIGGLTALRDRSRPLERHLAIPMGDRIRGNKADVELLLADGSLETVRVHADLPKLISSERAGIAYLLGSHLIAFRVP